MGNTTLISCCVALSDLCLYSVYSYYVRPRLAPGLLLLSYTGGKAICRTCVTVCVCVCVRERERERARERENE